MNTLGYVGSALVACGSVAWTLTTVAGRFDHAFDTDSNPPAPANDARALPEARSRRVSGFGSAMNMLLRRGVPDLPVRLRVVSLTRVAWALPAPANSDLAESHYYKRCSVCGEPLGQYKAFVTGAMSAVTRRCDAAPAHQDCAKFVATNPTRPPAVDVVLVWVTRTYDIDGTGDGARAHLGEAEQAFWYLDGRRATRDEVRASFESQLPSLYAVAHESGEAAVLELDTMVARATRFFPKHSAAAHVG